MTSCCNINGLPSSEFFKALGDPTRLQIFAFILSRNVPTSVSVVAEQFPVDRSVVSRHLSALKAGGILTSKKEGKEVLYALDYQNLAGVVQHFANAIDTCCSPDKR